MYYNTDLLSCRTNTPWWNLSRDGEIKFNLVHNPKDLTTYAQGTIRRWLRSGYCDAINGEASKRWEMLMLANRAKYIMTVPKNRNYGIVIRLINEIPSAGTPDVSEINALLLLYFRSMGSTRPYDTPAVLHPQASFHELKIDSTHHSGTELRTDNSGSFWGKTPLLKLIVEKLGHPLGSKPSAGQALDMVNTPVKFRVDMSSYRKYPGGYLGDNVPRDLIRYTTLQEDT